MKALGTGQMDCMAVQSAAMSFGERPAWIQTALDLVTLTKPRITTMVLLTVAVAAFVGARGHVDGWILLHTVCGAGLVAIGSSIANQFIEWQSDARMARTCLRPLAARRFSRLGAGILCFVTTTVGLSWLAVYTTEQAALWAAATWFGYVLVYTPLKRITSLNTVVGAVVGALPVLIGWTAVGAPLGLRGLAIAALLFLWQFPHFMAIAWLYRDDYRRGLLRMTTVVDPTGKEAGRQAVLATLALLPISMVPGVYSPAWVAVVYMLATLLGGVAFLGAAVAFFLATSNQTARLLLRASLVYLPFMLFLLVWLASC